MSRAPQSSRAPTGRKAPTLPLPRRGAGGRRIVLLTEEWPEKDRQAWTLTLTATRRSQRTRASTWSQATRKAVASAYGLWLAWLSATDQLDPSVPPAQRASLELVDAFAGFLHDNGQPTSSLNLRLGKLAMALDAMDPAGKGDRRWLRAFVADHPARLPEEMQAQLRLKVTPSDLLRLGMELMQEGDALVSNPRARSGQRGAVRFRDGLMLALQSVLLLRPASLTSLVEGVSVVRTPDGGFRITLPPTNTKGRRPLDAPIPQELHPAIERYLAVHRPCLLKGRGGELPTATESFWVTDRGRPMSSKVAWDAVRRTAAARFDVPLSVHRVRHVGASHIAAEVPEILDHMRDVLHHKDERSMRDHYDLASRHLADERYQATLDAARGDGIKDLRRQLAALRKAGPKAARRTSSGTRRHGNGGSQVGSPAEE